MKHHVLKVWPAYFLPVALGLKPFELRRNDRDYQPGDTVSLQEWNPKTETYTGDSCVRRITYVIRGPLFGLEEGYCIFGMGAA